MKSDKERFAPDCYGYPPTDCPLVWVMDSQSEGVNGGLIVRTMHGGKLGLTHMDRLIKADNEHAALCAVAEAAAKLETVATAMLAGRFNGKAKSMHEAIGEATKQARETIVTFAAIRKAGR